MSRVPAAAAVALAVAAASAACSGGFGPEDSDAVVVHGDVTAAADGPVADAAINVTAFSGNCGSTIYSNISIRTDSTGAYHTSVINFRSGFRRCVEIQAVPPQGSGLESRLVQIPDVPLSDDAAVDSLRVDIALDSISGG